MIVYDKNSTIDSLSSIELKTPSFAGKRWKGVQHADLAQGIKNRIESKNWKILDEGFSVSKDQADLVGAFEVELPDVSAPEGQSFSVGFVHSNAQRKGFRMMAGTRVHVCHNGLATGELILNKKHTTNLQLEDQIDAALDLYKDSISDMKTMIEALRQTELSHDRSNEILMEAGRTNVLPWSHIGMVDREYRKPTYADHDEKTSFGLLQAFTHIVKKSNPQVQMQKMNEFRQLLPSNLIAA